MKKLLSITIILAMALSMFAFTSVFAADTVIFADSFENGSENWKLGTANATEENSKLVTDKASDGKVSACIIDDSDSKTFGLKSINIPVVVGQPYTVSGDIWHLNSGDGRGAVIYFAFYDADNKRIGSSFSANTTKKEQWDSVTRTEVAPEGAVALVVILTGGGTATGTSYIDNIKVTTIGSVVSGSSDSTSSVAGVVLEEDFENGLGNWNIYKEEETKSKYEIITDDVKGGKSALKVTDDLTDVRLQATSDKFIAKPGTNYTISFDGKLLEGEFIKVYLQFQDAAGKSLYSKSISIKSNEWKAYTATHTVPEGAVQGVVIIWGQDKNNGTAIIDNIKVTTDAVSGGDPTEETKLDKINKSSIVLFIGSPNALVNGNKTLIDTANDKVIADTVNGRTLVPVRFIAENYGAQVGWDDPTQTVTLKMADKTVTIVLNKNEIDINGQKITIDVPAQTIQDRTMLPLRAFVESVMGKTIFWDDRGLIVITDEAMLDAAADKATIDTIINNVK